MGTGNKLDPSQFRVAGPLPDPRLPPGPRPAERAEETGDSPSQGGVFPRAPRPHHPGGDTPARRRSVPASAPWVPPVAGFLLAGAVIQDLIAE